MTSTDQRPAPDRASAGPTTGAHNELRAVMGMFATGVTVVTSGKDIPQGMTANAFTSVSLDPAMVLVCVKRTAVMHDAVLTHGTFVVSILAAGQEELARYFANPARPRDKREFDTVPNQPGALTGAPVIAGCLAWVECKLAAVYDGGDHSIFLGSVLGIGRGGTHDALIFHTGRFADLTGRV